MEEHNTTVGMLDRVFGLRGAILEGTGVADLAANVVNWQSSSEGISNDLSSVYIARISNAWHVDEHGKINVTNNTDQFKYLLGKLTLLTQNLDSTWRLTDTDDYADWFGGLLNAANTQGARVNTQLLDIRDKNNIVSSTLVEEMQKEVRNTLLNPTYIQSVSDSAAGWNSMAYKVENIMKVMFTTQRYAEDSRGNALRVNYTGNNAGAIGSGLVKQIGKLLVDDNFAINKDYKAYAFQSMAGWLLTTDMNGFWESNQELREQLANKYISIVPQYGIACCHHTCKNFKFNEWVVKTSTVPDSVKNQYLDVMTQATNTDYSKFKSNDPTNTIVEDSADGVEDLDDIITTIGQDASGVDNAVATDPVGQQGTMTRTGDASASLYAEVQGDSSENSNSTSGNDNGQSGGSSGSSASGSSSSGSTSGNSGTGTSASDASGSGTSTNGNSNGTGSSVGDTSSSDGESASAGASGENSASDGISSAAGAVYEVVKKKLSKSAAQESEIAVGYIVAIIAIAALFFVGFTRKSPRYK
ncbi:MAG: hypothetical protein BZ136_06870 [Methanosphaera sp. rholeuAM74]|nr:MAG: hypothetical protein BZ136_06870 [Methanosphaera sp. rholeuAM74]